MTSAIDVTVPIYGNPTTKSVRDNFATAHDEIGALQTDVGTKVNRSGDTMTGFLSLYLDPELPTHAATKSYVDAMAFTGGGGTVAAQSVTVAPAIAGLPGANVYDALGSAFPKSGGTFTGGISFGANIGANTGDASKHITLYDGFAGFSITPNRMNAFAGAALGSGAAFFVTINGLDRLAVAEDLVSITAPLVLPADPTAPLQAATKQYVDSKSGGASLTVADTPPTIANGKMWFDSNKTQLYVGYDDGTSSQWVIANNPNTQQSSAALQPSYNNVGRNLIHNSMFNVQQRFGGPFAARSLFTADRWQMDFIGGTLSVSLPYLTDANRASIGDEFARYQMVLSFTGGSATGDETYLQQSIEGVTRTAGKTITVSFWAAATSGTPKFGVALYQLFGTGGSPSPTIFVSGQSVTLSTTYTRYTMIFTIPSMSGKTVGTNGNDCLLFRFAVSAGSTSSPSYGNIGVQTGQIGIWGVQLEIGNTATPLEKPDPQIDLANCQRFYQKGFFDFGIYGLAANSASSGFSFPVQMRATPTVTTSGVTFFNSSGLVTTAWSNSWLSVGYVITANGMTRTYGEFQASADL